MEVGHAGNTLHSVEIRPNDRSLAKLGTNLKYYDCLPNDLGFTKGCDALLDALDYCSDGETSSSGHTESSNSSILALPPSSPVNSKLIGIEEDLAREVGADVYDLTEFGSIPKFVQHRIEGGYEVGSFLVTNLATIMSQMVQWRKELPMVEPFYAVKCNPDPVVLRLLSHLGCNFDCATMGEIDLVCNGLGEELSFGAKGLVSRGIVYANPAKMVHMIDFALSQSVAMTVFDGEDELHKMVSVSRHERLQLLLRLTTDDVASVCRFSKKFGCPAGPEVVRLLKVAKTLGLNVVGVSFHVGSGCGDAAAYSKALSDAANVFAAGRDLGFTDMHVVDLGGGYPGDTTSGYGGEGMPTFVDLAKAIREGIAGFLAALPPQDVLKMRFIAEPGRYFVSACTTVATKIYARKESPKHTHSNGQALYVDDGVYGTFNNVVYDHAHPIPLHLPSVLSKASDDKVELWPTAVFGPTCDGLDQMCVPEHTLLPKAAIGDWLIWENMGAYTHTASFVFNGYTHLPKKTYCYHV